MIILHRAFVALAFLLVALTDSAEAQGPELHRIAFGSCADQEKPQPIWKAIIDTKSDLFLFLGDNIYADTKDPAVLEKTYAKLAKVPGYQQLLKTCPIRATWDDHDYGWDDAGADYSLKDISQKLFLDFFGVPKDSPRRQRKGIYHAEFFGPPEKRVQVILLDMRYFCSSLKKRDKYPRDFGPYVSDTDSTKTFLGEAQWKWLEGQLSIPAQLRLLCSSIQVVPEDHGWEKWMNFPRERERLYKLIKDTGASGVVFLSGDRHLAELSVMDGGVGYPLYDLTSSGLNQGAKKWRPLEANRHRLATMNQGNNFGLITLDWSGETATLTLRICDEEGEGTIRQKLPLSLLRQGSLLPRTEALARLINGKPLTEEEVKAHLGKQVTVEMTVSATGASAALVFLNSSEDWLSEENFTVVLDKEAQAKLKQSGVESPRTYYQGQAIRATGVLSLYSERPQIIVSDPSRISILKK